MLVVLALVPVSSPLFAAEIIVAPSGGDYTSIQAALDAANAGDTVTVLNGTYTEALTFPRSGSAGDGYITLQAGGGETVVVDPNTNANVISIQDKSYLRITGIELTNSHSLFDHAGIRIEGRGDHIRIMNNTIHDLRGTDAMGILVAGTDSTPISDIIIDGNLIYDCEPAQSEALVLNGNVTGFEVTDNTVHDVNNIGIDFIGGEIWTGNHGVARNGICRGNHVYRARSNYGGGYGAGIYVDGGADIIIERNNVHECDLGIEIGAENAGVIVTGVIVRNNIVYKNDKAGIVFGGYDAARGRVNGCDFIGNTLYLNDLLQDGNGEFWVNWGEGNRVRNNIIYAGEQNLLIRTESGSANNIFNYNLYYTAAGLASAEVNWQGMLYTGFENYRNNTGQDADSLFADPRLEAPAAGDFHLTAQSLALDTGDMSAQTSLGEYDYYGDARIRNGTVDIGADEYTGNPDHPAINSGDYNGDGRSDIAVFRPASGLWAVRGVTRVYFGSPSDIPIPGDYSGNGTTEIGIFRSGTGLWAIRELTRVYFGSSSDIAVPGDYDGNGSCVPGIFRGGSGLWAIRGVSRSYFGTSGDQAVPGDYNGSGRWIPGIFRPSSGLWAIRGVSRFYFGSTGDAPVAGDYNGDGTRKSGLFRPSSGLWAIRGVTRVYFGSSSDDPVPADYNGNGADRIGIFRGTAGLWAIRGISRVYYGSSGDIPVTR